jgi:hypothetical protein
MKGDVGASGRARHRAPASPRPVPAPMRGRSCHPRYYTDKLLHNLRPDRSGRPTRSRGSASEGAD